MEWTKQRLKIADYTLEFLSKDRSMFHVIHLDKYYFYAEEAVPRKEEEILVFKALLKNKLIEVNPFNRISFRIKDKGMNALHNYNSMSDYFEYNKKLQKKHIREEKSENRKRKWNLFMKYVQNFNTITKAITTLIPIILLILSIVFSEDITTIKKAMQDYIKPETPTHQTIIKKDTIQKTPILPAAARNENQ